MRTKDIAFTAYLVCQGHSVVGTSHERGVCFWEVDVPDPDAAWDAFLAGGQVSATTFVGVWRRLKREAMRGR